MEFPDSLQPKIGRPRADTAPAPPTLSVSSPSLDSLPNAGEASAPAAGNCGNGVNGVAHGASSPDRRALTTTATSPGSTPTMPHRREALTRDPSAEQRANRLRSWSFTIPTGSINDNPTPPERTSVPVPEDLVVRPDPWSPNVPFRPSTSALLSVSIDTADLADFQAPLSPVKKGPLAASVSMDMAEMQQLHEQQRGKAGTARAPVALRVVPQQHPRSSQPRVAFAQNAWIAQPQPIRGLTPVPVQRPMSTPIIVQLEAEAAQVAHALEEVISPSVGEKAYNKHLMSVGSALQRPSSTPTVFAPYYPANPSALPPWMREAGLLQSI